MFSHTSYFCIHKVKIEVVTYEGGGGAVVQAVVHDAVVGAADKKLRTQRCTRRLTGSPSRSRSLDITHTRLLLLP